MATARCTSVSGPKSSTELAFRQVLHACGHPHPTHSSRSAQATGGGAHLAGHRHYRPGPGANPPALQFRRDQAGGVHPGSDGERLVWRVEARIVFHRAIAAGGPALLLSHQPAALRTSWRTDRVGSVPAAGTAGVLG